MTAWLAALVIAILPVLGLGLGVTQIAITQQQAQATADHAALAAASGGCDIAERVVSAKSSGAITSTPRMAACEVAGGDARVEIAIAAPAGAARLLRWLGASNSDVRARARAGFVSAQ